MAGARQPADSVTFSRVCRRGGRVSVVRRGGWRAIVVARQPNLGLSRAAILREWRRSHAKSASPMRVKLGEMPDPYIGVLEPQSLRSE